MPCVSADGKLTVSGKKLISTLNAHPNTSAEEISKLAETPLFRVRSGLRELLGTGFVQENNKLYSSTEEGKEALKRS
jgi:predicted transcriptional regulator